MVFGKKDHLVGLDIGSAFIKVAELKISRKGTTLRKFGMSRVPEGAIAEGRVMDMEAVADTIQDLFKSQKIKEKNVAISTGGHSVVIKTINTAKADDKELQTTIYSEAEQYIPYDIEDVNIDFQILGDSEFSSDQMNVLLVAVKKDLVAEYIELIEMAGLRAKIIDVDTFALQNLYETLPDANDHEVAMLVDVGDSKTSLNVVKDKASLMMRDTVSGTHQIREALMDRLDIDHESAEKIILGQAGEGENKAELTEICQEVVDIWCTEICEVVHTFHSSTNENQLEKIILSGGGSFVQGLVKSLKDELDLPVSLIQPFGGMELNPKAFPESYLTESGPQAPIALGLALRRVDDK